MTVQHADGTTCMADVWKQSAELLMARAEEAEAMIGELWDLITPQEPSPEFTARVEALIARMKPPDVVKKIVGILPHDCPGGTGCAFPDLEHHKQSVTQSGPTSDL